MKISAAGLALIKKYEGFRPEAYLCPAGVWTIGYGTTRGVRKGQRVSEFDAEQMLKLDVVVVEHAIRVRVGVALNQNQFDALASFVYNVGVGAFERSTMLRILNTGDYEGAADQFARWNKAGGKVLTGLVRRRAEEALLFCS